MNKETKYSHLTKEQRYTIAVCLRENYSLSAIAKLIGVHKSTISREIKRNSNQHNHYVAIDAQQFCDRKKAIPRRPCKLSKTDWEEIKTDLKKHWSPETIAGVRKKEGKTCVSFERLYQYIRKDKAEGGDLYTFLPHHLKHRRRYVSSRIPIKDRVSIDERPAIVDTNTQFGHWEMDTIVGKGNRGAIVTLVERTTKKLIMAKSPKGKNAKTVSRLVVQLLRPYEQHVLTITTDNGTEFADHKYIARKLHTSVYFTHPYSSWEKGLIENTNKLIRQYIPKSTDFSTITPTRLADIQADLNLRPRKNLNFSSPKQKFSLSLQTPLHYDIEPTPTRCLSNCARGCTATSGRLLLPLRGTTPLRRVWPTNGLRCSAASAPRRATTKTARPPPPSPPRSAPCSRPIGTKMPPIATSALWAKTPM